MKTIKDKDWGNCIYCKRSMWTGNHRPQICGKKECQKKADDYIKEHPEEFK